jgi:3-oxoacyl-[acyl-carrier protein] reductase
MELGLTGKVALVTGSSRGIGRGIAEAFASEGCDLLLTGRDTAVLEEVAASVRSKGRKAAVIVTDLRHPAAPQTLVAAVQREFGGLDILINNAGIIRDRTMKKMTQDDWNSVLRTNLDGTFHCTQQAARILRPGGRIVNMSSLTALTGFFGQANYAASKAGVIALTKVAARELARQQITVNAIAPGFVDTEMTRTMPPEVTKQFLSQIPLGRFAEIDDIVGVALFLCSNLARYVTGQVIHVNGGFWMG